jgi:hypothetical protein
VPVWKGQRRVIPQYTSNRLTCFRLYDMHKLIPVFQFTSQFFAYTSSFLSQIDRCFRCLCSGSNGKSIFVLRVFALRAVLEERIKFVKFVINIIVSQFMTKIDVGNPYTHLILFVLPELNFETLKAHALVAYDRHLLVFREVKRKCRVCNNFRHGFQLLWRLNYAQFEFS